MNKLRIVVIFTLENGVIYSLENCWSLPEKFPSYIDAKTEIVSTKGSLYIDFLDHGLKGITDETAYYPDLYYWPDFRGEIYGALRDELIHFVEFIKSIFVKHEKSGG